MQEYRVNLANGQTYTIRASSAAQAARLANETAQESGNEVLNVTAIDSDQPITTRLPTGIVGDDGQMTFEPGPGVSFGVAPTLSDEDRADRTVNTMNVMTDTGASNVNNTGDIVANALNTIQNATNTTSGFNPLGVTIPISEVDPFSAFQRSIGATSRALTDPFRRFLESNYNTFLDPFRFGRAFGSGSIGDAISGGGQPFGADVVPTFENFVSSVGTPQAARELASNVFSNVVSGNAGPEFQNVLGGPFRIDTTTGLPDPAQNVGARSFGMLQQPEQEFLGNLENLGRTALRGRIGPQAFNLISGLLPNVGNLYNQYFADAQEGRVAAPTFGTYLQQSYGI